MTLISKKTSVSNVLKLIRNMDKKGLTITIIMECESSNYGDSIGNISSLKKITRGNGSSYTLISRQSLRYNIVMQMGIDNTPIDLFKEVLQFSGDATIKDYPEIDLFGYMKTAKPVRTRAAVCRLSNAISLEPFSGDTDFLTNKSLLDRYNMKAEKIKEGGNISQSEIHKSFYSYTVTVDLSNVGIDGDCFVDNEEKAKRINELLNAIQFLHRDIRGREENLNPIFVIGGIYDVKNPFFHNRLVLDKRYNLNVNTLSNILNQYDYIKKNTRVGLIPGKLGNDKEIEEFFGKVNMGEFFTSLKDEVTAYYKGFETNE